MSSSFAPTPPQVQRTSKNRLGLDLSSYFRPTWDQIGLFLVPKLKWFWHICSKLSPCTLWVNGTYTWPMMEVKLWSLKLKSYIWEAKFWFLKIVSYMLSVSLKCSFCPFFHVYSQVSILQKFQPHFLSWTCRKLLKIRTTYVVRCSGSPFRSFLNLI